MKITMTIDTERLAEFGGGDETVQDFMDRIVKDRRTGGKYVWTTTTANVGTIDKVTGATVPAERDGFCAECGRKAQVRLTPSEGPDLCLVCAGLDDMNSECEGG